MSDVLLDTSALLFWTLSPKSLSQTAAEAIGKAGQICVSGISLWEVGVKAGKGKLHLPLPLREFANRLKSVERVRLLDVSSEDWIATVELAWEHRDPADRVVVATAMRRGLPLITSDGEMKKFYSEVIW